MNRRTAPLTSNYERDTINRVHTRFSVSSVALDIPPTPSEAARAFQENSSRLSTRRRGGT